MYPFIRLAKDYVKSRYDLPLPVMGTHTSWHRCWPQDIDGFLEMNNGRILTIMDLGRFILAKRVGLLTALKVNGWGMTMAGSSVRYRKRIRPFVRFKATHRCVGWDDKFFYLEHAFWIDGECAAHALYRSAVTDKNGIVRPGIVFRSMGYEGERPTLPAWVQGWIDADKDRPWPPQFDTERSGT